MVSKKNINIFFIICPNGYGHAKRSFLIINKLYQKNNKLNFSILIDKDKKKLASEILINKLSKKIKFYYYPYNLKNILKIHEELENKSLIKKLLSADHVISDNMAHPLSIRKDLILIGSFLWSDILSKKNPSNLKFIKQERNLIKKYKPLLICLKKMIYMKTNKNIKLIFFNWMRERKIHLNKKKFFKNKKKINVLISPSKFYSKSLISNIINKLNNEENINLYLPKSLMKGHFNNKVRKFHYSNSNFKKIDFNICRAGVGAIEDSVQYNIPIMALPEKSNLEIISNLKNIKKYKLGFTLDISNLMKSGLYEQLRKKNKEIEKIYYNLSKQSFDGLEKLTNYLGKRFYS